MNKKVLIFSIIILVIIILIISLIVYRKNKKENFYKNSYFNLKNTKLEKLDTHIRKYTFNKDFKDRQFYISNPTLTSGKKYPIVLLFHGGGESVYDKKGKGVLNYTEFYNTESFCIAPKGQKSNNGHSWLNAYPWLKKEPQNDVEFVENIIETLKKSNLRKFIDFNRIYASGKSDGAGFCLYLNKHSNTIDLTKIGICSGAYFTKDSVKPENKDITMNETPILEIHGTKDQVMPYKGQHFVNPHAIKKAEYWKKKDSTLKNTYTFDVFPYLKHIAENINKSTKHKESKFKGKSHIHNFTDKNNKDVLIHIKVEGQNHCWSGHNKSGPDSSKPENHYFDATEEICKFFDIKYKPSNK